MISFRKSLILKTCQKGPVYNDPPQTPGPVYGGSYNNPVYSPGDQYQQRQANQFRQPSSNQPMSNVAVKQMKPPETPGALDYQAQTEWD